MPDVRVELLPTTRTLKRHVVHDEASRAYALPDAGLPPRPIIWPRLGPVYDQNRYNEGRGLGCCTACAGYGLLMSSPFWTGRVYTDQEVVELYHQETIIDESEIPGVWPPDDPGSAGLYLMKALRGFGLIDGYRHAFTLRAALAALNHGPIAVGTLWLASMEEPVRGTLQIDPRSEVVGGHEYEVRGYDPAGHGWVLMQNSWGEGWGVDVGGPGCAWIPVPAFAWLLARRGDVVQPNIPTHRGHP